MKMILASASPRRKDLLARLHIPFETIESQCDEQFIPGETAQNSCLRLAQMKSQQIAAEHPDDLVIGADTVVLIDSLTMGKPKDIKDARNMLIALSGRTHLVITAVALSVLNSAYSSSLTETTEVSFYPLSDDDIEYYLSVSDPLDKAGAYGIQDWSGVFIEKVKGCYDNVVGFPIAKFYRHLKQTVFWSELPRRNDL